MYFSGNMQATLDLLAQASSDIAMGDIVGRALQSANVWSLLPTQAIFACLRPGRLLRGPLPGGAGGVVFPTWFGKNSTQSKNSRLLSELSQHTRLSTHGGANDPRSLLLDYLQPLAIKLTAPLKEGGCWSWGVVWRFRRMSYVGVIGQETWVRQSTVGRDGVVLVLEWVP